jgi:hypothetical protein
MWGVRGLRISNVTVMRSPFWTVRLAMGREVIHAPPCTLYISLAILHRKYTGARDNDLTAHG